MKNDEYLPQTTRVATPGNGGSKPARGPSHLPTANSELRRPNVGFICILSTSEAAFVELPAAIVTCEDAQFF